MKRAHVIGLILLQNKRRIFRKACGVARHAYNWALARWKEARAEGKRIKSKSSRWSIQDQR